MIKIKKEEKKVLEILSDKKEIGFKKLMELTGLHPSLLNAILVNFKEKGWIEIKERKFKVYSLREEGDKIFNLFKDVFDKMGDCITFSELKKLCDAKGIQIGTFIKWTTKRGLCQKVENTLTKKEKKEPLPEEKLLNILMEKDLPGDKIISLKVEEGLHGLKLLKNVLKEKERTERFINITEKGEKILEEEIEVIEEVTQLTPDLIISGKWREVVFKEYDVKAGVQEIYPGKLHPLTGLIQKIRRIFLEMGFKEIRSPYVELAFWNFDALFQPQDHPAREMHDTFYLKMEKGKLPEKFVKKVKEFHEKYWKYKWSEEEAQKYLLRTHTTATTIRYLAEHPVPPQKVFCVGRVFRREKVDYKHLCDFHHIDGIVIDENVNLATLMGLLSEFYKKMGFKDVRFRPAYFPYTEPSVEVFVYFEEKGDWFELGGAGIFRPEVTLPFGCEVPVLAWGLGIERLAMLLLNLEDIRMLQKPDIGWIRELPVIK